MILLVSQGRSLAGYSAKRMGIPPARTLLRYKRSPVLDLTFLIQEVSDTARINYDEESAREWAKGYVESPWSTFTVGPSSGAESASPLKQTSRGLLTGIMITNAQARLQDGDGSNSNIFLPTTWTKLSRSSLRSWIAIFSIAHEVCVIHLSYQRRRTMLSYRLRKNPIVLLSHVGCRFLLIFCNINRTLDNSMLIIILATTSLVA